MAIGTLAMCYNNHKVFTGILGSPRDSHLLQKFAMCTSCSGYGLLIAHTAHIQLSKYMCHLVPLRCIWCIHMTAGVVKMRRGETAKYMRNVNMHGDLYDAFQHFVTMLSTKVCSVPVHPAMAAMRHLLYQSVLMSFR